MEYKACLNAFKKSPFCAVLAPVNTLFLGNMTLWHANVHATQCFTTFLGVTTVMKVRSAESPMSMYDGLLSLLLRRATMQTFGTALPGA